MSGSHQGSRGFEFLEHTSDVYVRAYGRDLAEAFEEAGKALFSVLVRNAGAAERRREVEVTARGYDRMSLLYDWLERLLLVFQLEKLVASDVRVKEISEESGELVIRGRAIGEDYDPEKHVPGIDVKAPTYWLMEVNETSDGVELKFVLDI
ncbi:MAG: archease [Nitrososphaerota archaeon]|nr:archease [Candidatus Calditenuis fumarioli]